MNHGQYISGAADTFPGHRDWGGVRLLYDEGDAGFAPEDSAGLCIRRDGDLVRGGPVGAETVEDAAVADIGISEGGQGRNHRRKAGLPGAIVGP